MIAKRKNNGNQWIYEVPKFNTGKETIDDMSLMMGMYGDYIVTKTGYLVGIIETTGINMDLLNEYEQEDVFDSYNAFLMSVIGEQVKERHQYMELTIPVDMEEYLMNLKKKYLQAKREPVPNLQFIRLTASYIDYYSNVQYKKNMTTKKHLLIVREKIKNRSLDELETAKESLIEKLDGLRRDLESSFSDVDMRAFILTGHEITDILKTLINFKS